MGDVSLEDLHERWRALCLELPGAFEDFPFGEGSTVFKIAGRDRAKAKMFGLLMEHRGELLLNLKCEPAIADQLRSDYEQIIPGYHMSKKTLELSASWVAGPRTCVNLLKIPMIW